MRIQDLLENKKQPDLIAVFKDFFPLAMEQLKISKLPKIILYLKVPDDKQPTFGKFVNDENVIYLGIENRHPIDIVRTLAHELVHFKQSIENKLNYSSGETGSPAENEAHEVAGIIMRHFDKQFPKYFDELPVNIKENMDHSKDSQAVPELKSALLAQAAKLKKASDDEVYDIIDKIMTRIAKSHGISGQKLHDMWVKKYKQIPDTWIMNKK